VKEVTNIKDYEAESNAIQTTFHKSMYRGQKTMFTHTNHEE